VKIVTLAKLQTGYRKGRCSLGSLPEVPNAHVHE